MEPQGNFWCTNSNIGQNLPPPPVMVKASEKLGVTVVAPVVPAVMSMAWT